MKIYISTDLEGATNVFRFAQTREKETPLNIAAIGFLLDDVAAVVQGLRQAGADEIYVVDGHDGGYNFMYAAERMAPGARYVTGFPRRRPYDPLDSSFDGAIELGFHAMNGTPDGVLHHTQSSTSEAKYWYDGVERGEIFQTAVIAGHYDVPIMLVTGDVATCREARETLGENLPTVAVKEGLSREAAILIPPEETREMLIEGARRAVEALPDLRPYKIKLPCHAKTRRMNPAESTLETPYYAEREMMMESQLDVRLPKR